MNVAVPGGDVDNLGWFLGIVASMVVFAVVAVIIFWKLKWL
jgi:Mg2+ and Co2+ transporter CorA